MGDLLFSDSYPALLTAYGGDLENFIQTLARLIDELPEDIKLIAGHGRNYSLEDLREYHQMIATTGDLIKGGLAGRKGRRGYDPGRAVEGLGKMEHTSNND